MDVDIIVAIISGVVAIFGAVLAGVFSFRAVRTGKRLDTELEQQRVERERQERAEQRALEERQQAAERQRDVIGLVTEPLLYAASDLQSRIWNLIAGHFAETYAEGAPRHQRSITEYTCFLFAQYFGWVEALRRSVLLFETSNSQGRAGDAIGDVAPGGRPTVAILTRAISDALRTDKLGRDFMIFSGEQHAIGAQMFRWDEFADRRVPSVMRYDEFAKLYREGGQFAEWFESVEEGVKQIQLTTTRERLEQTQSLLVALMELLDPEHAVYKTRTTLLPRAELATLISAAVARDANPPSEAS